MRVSTLATFFVGFLVGRWSTQKPIVRQSGTGRRGEIAEGAPSPIPAATVSAGGDRAIDLPRWNLRLLASETGAFVPSMIADVQPGGGVSPIYADFLRARHSTDEIGDGLHDFGVRTHGGPDYARLLGELGAANVRLGTDLDQAVLNDPEVRAAAASISSTADRLTEAAQKTRLPTAGVGDFTLGIGLVNEIAGLFKR